MNREASKSTIAALEYTSEGTVRKKKGYSSPSLRALLVDVGEMSGTPLIVAAPLALTDAPEHPAPMIAETPCLSNANQFRTIVPFKAAILEHMES